MKKIMLIDGHSIINRAFYALPVLTTKTGEYTNAVLGFMNIFFKLLDEEKPDFVTAAFDLPAPTFRHEMFAEYKGTRKPSPPELRPQVGLVKNLLTLMNVPIATVVGFEADDVLGTLAVRAEKEGLSAVIVSGDKDLLQIATNAVKIRIPKTKGGKTEVEDFFAEDVLKKIGVTPQQLIDMKALMGDTSDNIPGVPGIGEKTALKIITEFGSLDAAIENAADITPKKAAENLAANKELAVLSRKLATINTQTPINCNFTPFSASGMFNPASFAEFKRLQLKSHFYRFGDAGVASPPLGGDPTGGRLKAAPELQHRHITNKDGAAAFFAEIGGKDAAYVFSDEGLAVCCGEPAFIQLPQNDLIEVCAGFFEGAAGKIALNAKKDIALLQKHGLRLNNLIFDITLAAYVLNTTLDEFERPAPEPPKQLTLFGNDTDADFQKRENAHIGFCRQAAAMLGEYPLMKREIEENGQNELYFNIELPLAQVLHDMEIGGIRADKAVLIEMSGTLQQRIDVLTDEIHTLAGGGFNLNSPKQLAEILFDKMGIGGKSKTRSTAADVLEKLAHDHEIAAKILEYRKYAKLKSTYADGLLNVIDSKTGRIHSKFNQTAASTGRISSSEPNLQNIPVRTELGRELRKVFVPAEGCVFIDADYSQIELRILAGLAGDETMTGAFTDGRDIHTATAAQVFHVDIDRVTADQRGFAKAVNFGIVYGMGAYSLSEDIGVSVKEAGDYINRYFKQYPKIKAYLDGVKESAARLGYAETLFKRRRAIPELKSSNHNTRAFGERAAMNMPVQGSAADIIKLAMVKVHKRLASEGLKSRLILQVHDELLLEVPENEKDTAKRLLKEEMENTVNFPVPLIVDVKEGNTWFETK